MSHRDDDNVANGDTAAPVSRGKRFMKLAGMTASVAGRHVGSRVKSVFQTSEDARAARNDSYKASGERIAKTLGELKGAAMKIGQMASIGSDILPKELSDALSKLQNEAPPMAYEVIAGQIESELGELPERLFDWFDAEPFAAASIGQVHRARTDDGREVIVKVQYPGVDGSVDSDLSHLKLALRASGLVQATHKKALGRVFEEVRARLHEELDYCIEADNVRAFGAFHADHDHVVVPEVVGERSSKRVLTLTFEPGDPIRALDKPADGVAYDQETRDAIGLSLFRVMAAQLFEFQAIQADPNPANYAFRKDGRVVLYDFGCVKRIDDAVLDPYKALIRAAIAEDYAECEEHLVELGVRVPGTPDIPDAFYKSWRDLFLTPLLNEAQPYDYAESELHQQAMKLVPQTLKYITSFQPPHELVFVDRTVVGNYGNLRAIGARGDYMPLLAPYLDPPHEGESEP